jgi:hypothetical protein
MTACTPAVWSWCVRPTPTAGVRPGQQLLAPIRQLIESVHDTLKGQLDLELHGGRSLAGVTARVAQRLLALTATIWRNRATASPSQDPWSFTTTDPVRTCSSGCAGP